MIIFILVTHPFLTFQLLKIIDLNQLDIREYILQSICWISAYLVCVIYNVRSLQAAMNYYSKILRGGKIC